MSKSIKGTQTEKNLLAAFAGESQARNRYTYFAGVAKKAGFEQIAAIFLETADNEKEHAKRFFKFLEGGDVEITAAYPAGVIGDTAQNLKAAADGEKMEWTDDLQGLRRHRREGRLPRGGRGLQDDRQGRAGAREALPGPAGQRPVRAASSRRARPTAGSAATAATSTRAPKPRPSAPPASTPRPTSRSKPRTTDVSRIVDPAQRLRRQPPRFPFPSSSTMRPQDDRAQAFQRPPHLGPHGLVAVSPDDRASRSGVFGRGPAGPGRRDHLLVGRADLLDGAPQLEVLVHQPDERLPIALQQAPAGPARPGRRASSSIADREGVAAVVP